MNSSLVLLYRLILRPLLGAPLRTALVVAAVALGVGVVVAIELAGRSAAGSFRSSLGSLAREADFEITAAGGLSEELLGELVRLPYPFVFLPRVEGFGRLAASGALVEIAGADLVAESALLQAQFGIFFEALLDERSVWCGPAVAAAAGERIRLVIHDSADDYVVRGLLDGPGQEATVLMDIAAAQRVLRKQGRLDRIEVRLPPDASGELEAALRSALPEGVVLQPAGARTEENRKMLAAFRWNLRLLSYIALLVGAFLIYNSVAVSVVRRRAEVGLLRALGATRGQVLGAFLAEAALLGALGAAAGLPAGRLMAEAALTLIASTVEALYTTSRPAPLAFDAGIAIMAFAVGIPFTLASALAPALEAAQVAPAEALARGRFHWQVRRAARGNLLLALLLGGAAAALSQAPPLGGKPVFGYAAAVLLVGAMALSMPALLAVWTRLPVGSVAGVEARLALGSLRASLGRSAVLAGALTTAIAMTVAVGILVGSFRQTVFLWLEQQLRADFYLQPATAAGAARQATLAPELADRLETLEAVAAVERFRLWEISLNGRPAYLAALDTEVARRWGKLRFLPGYDREAVLSRLPRGNYLLASEPLAYKHGLRAGDRIRLPLGEQAPELEILGIYYDYSNERGYLVADREILRAWLPDRAPTSLAIYLRPGLEGAAVRQAIERALAGHEVRLISSRGLLEEALRIFDRTFAITYALEAVAVLVAVMGIAGALLALVIDRRRELAVLRLLGATRGQLRRLLFAEAAALGLLAAAAGSALGFALALLLVFVINRQSFGWTIQLHWPVALLLGALALLYLATILAAWYPARIAARLNPIEVLHEE